MVGFMQIIVYMLGVLLVYKGIAILQIALVSPKEGPSRSSGIVIGLVSFIGAVAASAIFIMMAERIAAEISSNMNNMPR